MEFKTYLRAAELIGCRVRTLDGGSAAVRDLVADAATWTLPYLAVDAEAWVADREVLLASRSVSGIDEGRREITAALTLEQLRESPILDLGTPVTRDVAEQMQRFHGWEGQWDAETSSDETDSDGTADGLQPPAPSANEPLPGESNPDPPGLLPFERLQTLRGHSADGAPLILTDLLIDETDWQIPYLELRLLEPPDGESVLVSTALVDQTDPGAEDLYLSVDAEDLRQAPLVPYPGRDATGREIRILEGAMG